MELCRFHVKLCAGLQRMPRSPTARAAALQPQAPLHQRLVDVEAAAPPRATEQSLELAPVAASDRCRPLDVENSAASAVTCGHVSPQLPPITRVAVSLLSFVPVFHILVVLCGTCLCLRLAVVWYVPAVPSMCNVGIPHPMSPLYKLGKALEAAGLPLLAGLLPSLVRVASAGGELDRLGVGTRATAWRNDDIWSSRTSNVPWRWGRQHVGAAICSSKFANVAALLTVWIVCSFNATIVVGDLSLRGLGADVGIEMLVLVVANDVLILIANMYMLPLATAWYVTLKLGAGLVTHTAITIREAVERENVLSHEWRAHVVEPIAQLVKDVQMLSTGWGGAATFGCLACWVDACAQICYTVDNFQEVDACVLEVSELMHHNGTGTTATYCSAVAMGFNSTANSEACKDVEGCMFHPAMNCFWSTLALAVFLAVLPLMVLYDLACTSTKCDELLVALNDKRSLDPDVAKHAEICVVEAMLTKQGGGQGPQALGFIIAGYKLDKKFCFKFLFKVLGLTISTIGALLTLKDGRSTT
jgi:hypothetical protein